MCKSRLDKILKGGDDSTKLVELLNYAKEEHLNHDHSRSQDVHKRENAIRDLSDKLRARELQNQTLLETTKTRTLTTVGIVVTIVIGVIVIVIGVITLYN